MEVWGGVWQQCKKYFLPMDSDNSTGQDKMNIYLKVNFFYYQTSFPYSLLSLGSFYLFAMYCCFCTSCLCQSWLQLGCCCQCCYFCIDSNCQFANLQTTLFFLLSTVVEYTQKSYLLTVGALIMSLWTVWVVIYNRVQSIRFHWTELGCRKLSCCQSLTLIKYTFQNDLR